MICCLFPCGIIISSGSSISSSGSSLFNEIILLAIFDPATSTAAGIIFYDNCLPGNLPIFDPSFFNVLPYLFSLIFFAAVTPLITIFYHIYYIRLKVYFQVFQKTKIHSLGYTFFTLLSV